MHILKADDLRHNYKKWITKRQVMLRTSLQANKEDNSIHLQTWTEQTQQSKQSKHTNHAYSQQ